MKLANICDEICTLLTGQKGYSSVLHALEGGDKAPETWIAYNADTVEALKNDPLCPNRFGNEGVMTVFAADYELKHYSKFKCRNPELKILSISGADDPVPAAKQGLRIQWIHCTASVMQMFRRSYIPI